MAGRDDRAERFERLFRSSYGPVSAYARRRTDAASAEEAVAETFLVAWRRLESVPDDPLPWLYGVARRTLANQRRGQARAGAALKRMRAQRPRAPQREPGEWLADREALLLALAALPERDREVLRLWAWEDLDAADGARAAGCTRAAYAVRLHRARRRLAARLAELEAGHPMSFQPQEAP